MDDKAAELGFIIDGYYAGVGQLEAQGSRFSRKTRTENVASAIRSGYRPAMDLLSRMNSLLRVIWTFPCPRDTNGDGDCGRPVCPYCGKAIRDVLGDFVALYAPQPHEEKPRAAGNVHGPAERLRLLADWLDAKYNDRHANDEVQRDLRAYANQLTAHEDLLNRAKSIIAWALEENRTGCDGLSMKLWLKDFAALNSPANPGGGSS